MWVAADQPEEVEHCVEKLMRVFLHGVSAQAARGSGRRNDR